MVLPEPALGLGRPGRHGGVHRLLSPVGEVPPFDPKRSILYVFFVEFRFHLTGELAAKRSLIVRVFGQNNGRIRRPERRVPESSSRVLLGRSRAFSLLHRRAGGSRRLLLFGTLRRAAAPHAAATGENRRHQRGKEE